MIYPVRWASTPALFIVGGRSTGGWICPYEALEGARGGEPQAQADVLRGLEADPKMDGGLQYKAPPFIHRGYAAQGIQEPFRGRILPRNEQH